MSVQPGRFCPAHYHYRPRALARGPEVQSDPLIIAGGLYGNPEALDILESRARSEDATLIFNGDFHWFDTEAATFARLQRRVLGHHAIAGNVEAELAEPSGAGCGCAYPEQVDDTAVEHANAIMARLQGTPTPAERRALGELPYHLRARVGGHRIAIIHGDPESLAGWGLDVAAFEHETSVERLTAWFHEARADVFACSHTCLPHARALEFDSRDRAVINNGAAGMPNFAGDPRGLATRIATRPAPDALYGIALDGVYVEAIAIRYAHEAWLERFETWWPPNSPAHIAYHRRLTAGPAFARAGALGPGARPSAAPGAPPT